MKLGRIPVAMNSPWARPLASTPIGRKAKISCMMIVSPSIPMTSEMLVTLRGPPCKRLAWMITSTAAANCDRNARIGSFEAGHADHRFRGALRRASPSGCGMDRRHRALVTGVHGLNHVEGFGAPALTDDDPVGPHS